jgi:glycosyltransferase involved in cell wall biosynthesis
VLRLVSRLIVGGPAHNVCLLTANLERRKFTSWLAYGRTANGERTNLELARQMGIEPICIEALQRRPGLEDFRALLAIRRLLRDIRPHLLHTHTAKAGSIGRIAGLLSGLGSGGRPRLVHTFHGHVFDGYFGPYASRSIVMAERVLARLSDAIVVVSESVKRDLTGKYHVAPPEKVHVIPLGFEFGWTDRIAASRGWLRARFGIRRACPVIGSVGRLTEVKNLPMALEGFRRFLCGGRRDARLVLFGDGALRGSLEQQAQHMGIASQIHFAGWEMDRARIYSDLDVVCLTSFNEGTPVALIEAMAAGIPVVATDVGGVRDVVSDGIDGELVRSGDAEAFAEALGRVASRVGSLRESRRSSVRCAFSVQRLVRDTANLYQRVLEN